MLPSQVLPGLARGFGALVLAMSLLSYTEGAATRADQGSISEQAYWQLVDHTLKRLSQWESLPPESKDAALKGILDEWKAFDRVALPDGSVVPVAHDAILSPLSATPPEVGAARQLLERMQESRRLWAAPRHGPEALDALSSVLARPEFQAEATEASPLGNWLSSIRDRLLELWYGFLDSLIGRLAKDNAFRWGLWAAGALLLGLAAAYAVRRLQHGFVAEAEAVAPLGGDGAPLSAHQAFRQAQDLAQVGDYRAAVRLLYLSTLISLEDRGVLRYDRSRTNREYLRSVSERPEIAAVLRDVVEVFDRVWYGFQSIDRRTFARFAARVEDLRRDKK